MPDLSRLRYIIWKSLPKLDHQVSGSLDLFRKWIFSKFSEANQKPYKVTIVLLTLKQQDLAARGPRDIGLYPVLLLDGSD